jgi:cyclic pyranopterin phosphate synthase
VSRVKLPLIAELSAARVVLAAQPVGGVLADTLGRPLRELRLSVTDRCNFRCGYCMPKSAFGPGFAFRPKSEILSFEELARVASLFVGLGVRKIRLTGGEPLLRAELPELVSMLAPLGVELALTTNGSQLRAQAAQLQARGLRRITVSLDALDDAVYRRMNDVDFGVQRALDGIEAARKAGLGVKINCVVQRGVNEDEIVPLVRYGKSIGVSVRFIEFMDVGNHNAWSFGGVESGADIIGRITGTFPLQPVASPRYSGVATLYQHTDGGGEVGVITSVTKPFCGDCSRARVSADGRLYTCLFAQQARLDLRSLLRSGADDEELTKQLTAVWSTRDDRYSELRHEGTSLRDKVEMSFIGG